MTPWERLPDEPADWFRRFTDYLLLGPSRTLVAVWERDKAAKSAQGSFQPKAKKPSRYWQDMKIKWRWDERAAAYDQAQADAKRARDEAERLAEEDRWRARRRKQRDDEWDCRDALLERFKAMMRFPLQAVTTTDPDGREVTILPARWSFQTMVQIAEAMSKLGRTAAEMETDSVNIDVTSGGEPLASVADIVAEVRRQRGAETANA